MEKELGLLLTEAALPVLVEGSLAVRIALAECLASVMGPLPEADMVALVALTEVVFLGVPEGFDPKAVLRQMHPFVFEKLCAEIDRRGDGSNGPFVWVQCERAHHRGLHQPGTEWSFVRTDEHAGQTRFYLKNKRSGLPLVVIDNVFGQPED